MIKEFLKEYYGTFARREGQVIGMMIEVLKPMIQDKTEYGDNQRC